MKFQIKNRFSGAVQFECELPVELETVNYALQLGFAVQAAYRAKADLSGSALRGAALSCSALSGADLSGADLRGADLRGADLRRADLSGAILADVNLKKITLVGKRPVLQLGPLGSRADCLLVFLTDNGIYLRTGCFFGDLKEFSAAVEETHGTNEHAAEYKAAIALIKTHAKAWTPKE